MPMVPLEEYDLVAGRAARALRPTNLLLAGRNIVRRRAALFGVLDREAGMGLRVSLLVGLVAASRRPER